MKSIFAYLLCALGLACIAAPARADSDPYIVQISTVGATSVFYSTVTTPQHPMKYYALQVKGVGAAATTWDVRLDGSLDGVNFWTIVWNGTPDGDGTVKGSTWAWLAPMPYIRARIVSSSLGSASGLTVKAIATDR